MRAELPPTITALDQISGRYDGYLIDQWGVLHNGVETYPEALAALQALKAAGKRVIILSNSGRTGAQNAQAMAKMGISSSLYDQVLTAGDDAFDALGTPRDPAYQTLGRKALVLARPGDGARVEALGLERVEDVAEADFLFVLSMSELPQIPEDWLALLPKAKARNLPLICANPDLLRVQGEGEVLVGPGAVAEAYIALGGVSHYHGKPHPRIYRSALRLLQTTPERCLAIGDSLIHDVKGARSAGIDSLFVINGVHREKIDPADPDSLAAELTVHHPNRPNWIIERLR